MSAGTGWDAGNVEADHGDLDAAFIDGGDSAAVLELDAVTKTYPAQPPVVALSAVTFTVRRGELVAIVGPSGSGKSTLLHVMGTLERPSSGAVRITGLDVAGLSDRELSVVRATRIGFVFQQFFLAEHAERARQRRRRAALRRGPGAGAARPCRRGAGPGGPRAARGLSPDPAVGR